MRRLLRPFVLLASLGLAAAAPAAPAAPDEGMWLFTKPPTALLKERYGFEPSAAWLEHLQKSAVRFSTGGSGSVVSSRGLVMTNHHVGSDMLAALSTPERDLLESGFSAKDEAAELPCPNLALDILWSTEDVTARVNELAKGAATDAERGERRLAAIAAIEADSEKATGLQSEVVTLYQGGQYHLYRYRRFTDVRLVFAPEQSIAFFGGDTDNFEFPRFNLDCCFFRLYENGKPYRPEHFLRWSEAGASDAEFIAVAGHPGRTQRLFTADHLRFLRDVELPWLLARSWRDEMKLAAFAGRSEENARIANEGRQGIANGRKARSGLLEGLQNPAVIAAKERDDQALRAELAKRPELASLADAWDRIAAAQAAHRSIFEERQLFEEGWRGSVLARVARQILRLTEERTKPEADRLREYTVAREDTILRSIRSPEPVYAALETEWLAIRLSFLAERLGGEHPIVRDLLEGQAPRDRAAAIVAGTTLASLEAREALLTGGIEAVRASKDPLLHLMARIDGAARAVRDRHEREVEAVERSAYADLATALFALRGETIAPDATFSLRLSFGTVQGWRSGGETVPAFTTMAGLFNRARDRQGEPDFTLPTSWIAACEKLPKEMPFNFVCTADIIGGNSGSPVVNKAGEVVGLIFDGNLESLLGDVLYDGTANRAVAVDSRGLIESLRTVYGATSLADEITGTTAR